MKCSRQIFISLAMVASALALGSLARADTYPSRPIKVIVPYAPGGGADSFARLSAPELEKILGAQLLVENMAGANSALATLLKDKNFVEKLLDRGALPLTSTPEQMRALIEKEKKFTAEVLALTQIKVDE